MDLFSEILTIVLPVFAVIALGALLKRIGLIDATFLQQTNRLVYYVCLPLLLFYEIGRADFLASFNGRLVLGSILAVTVHLLLHRTAQLPAGGARRLQPGGLSRQHRLRRPGHHAQRLW